MHDEQEDKTIVFRSMFDNQPFIGFEKRIDENGNDMKVMGVLKYEDGKLSFSGDMDESARLFFEKIINKNNQAIAKEHTRLRALFEKKTGQHLKGLEASGYVKGRDDCLSELQEEVKP